MSRLTIYLSVVSFLLFACSENTTPDIESPSVLALTSEDIALNNRGVGLMGYFDYAQAHEVFAQAVERQPNWHSAKINLAIATLNRQLEGDEQLAIKYLQEVLAEDQSNLRAHFVLGLLMERAGETEKARQHFSHVVRNDPRDAYAAYYLGVNVQSDDPQRAQQLFKAAIDIDPYLRSAYYGSFLLHMRAGDRKTGEQMKLAYERLADNPRARLAETKYTRMGPKADAFTVDLTPTLETPTVPAGPLFEHVQVVAQMKGTAGDSALTAVDLQSDGLMDIVISSSVSAPTIVIAAEDEYRVDAGHVLKRQLGAASALAWGDLNNDGNIDVISCSDRGVTAFYDDGDQWRKGSNLHQLSSGRACQDINLFDADHDGDLDVLGLLKKGVDLYSNNGNDSFRSLVKEKFLEFTVSRPQNAVITDIDNDRDADLLIVGTKNEGDKDNHNMLINDRLWRYSADHDVYGTLTRSNSVAMSAADIDADGATEIFSVNDGQLVQWRSHDNLSWTKGVIGGVAITGAAQIDFVDFDGDGKLDLLLVDEFGITIWQLDGQKAQQIFAYEADAESAIAVVADADRGPSLMALIKENSMRRLLHWPPGTGRGHFVAISLKGKEERAESMRSNWDGIGTEVAIRRGSDWTVIDTFDHHTGRGQSLQPLAIGLGSSDQVDFVALNWSDGVFQTELNLSSGKEHVITETQRQLSSCPVVFAWNGEQWNYVSDVLGVAGIGFLQTPGVYGQPRPWEYFHIPSELIKPDNEMIKLMITEPMEEIALIDEVQVMAYHLAPGWHLLLDERMATSSPEVTGEALFFKRYEQPMRATTNRGVDLTSSLSKKDGVAADLGPVHARYLGRLDQQESITLEFGRALDSQPGRPVLRAYGWVEYPYSQTVFAAWQEDVFYQAPTLEARDVDGVWHVIYEHFGYPAGMPRTMALPLDALPPSTTQLRITSNLEIYWDYVDIVYVEDPGSEMALSVLALNEAEVSYVGFPKRGNAEYKRPTYDYAQRVPLWDTRYPRGDYTQWGPATELVARKDGAYAIIGPGEAVELVFSLADRVVGSARETWTTEYVLYTAGYAKDMDLFTEHSGTVGPLPPITNANFELHHQYNNRYQQGY